MSDEFDAVAATVHDRVTPSPEERERLADAVADLVDRAERAVDDLPAAADVVHVGSTARDTWLAGDRDVDLFVRFPPDLDRDLLREYGLTVGHAVLPESHEEYAEHPYVVGEYDEFAVDLVPCYAVETATAIRSAVDRTPFHSQYLDARLDDSLAGEVRICKQFLSGLGIYGSNLRTRGFSGFLAELLVLEHGGFRPLVEAAAGWRLPVVFDPDGHDGGHETAEHSGGESGTAAGAQFDSPLVVVDPTDPGRNVAAVCSADNVARLQHYARALLADPREGLFERDNPDPVDRNEVRETLTDRGTSPLAVRFDAPEVVGDQLWPQLEKSRDGVAATLDRYGFDVFRSAAFAETDDGAGGAATGDAVLLFELAVDERPRIERHEGPPVHVREHAVEFYETYAGEAASGPFVDGDRYVVERDREYADARSLLEGETIFDAALGAHVQSALEQGYDLLVGDEVALLADSFGVELARYFTPEP